MPEPQGINLPMVNIADFCFNVASLVAINVVGYTEGEPGRIIIVYLVGPHEHYFTDERADKAWHWYLNLTGQARIT